jgi:hypothetical protein
VHVCVCGGGVICWACAIVSCAGVKFSCFCFAKCQVLAADPEAGLEALLAMNPPLKPDLVMPIMQV